MLNRRQAGQMLGGATLLAAVSALTACTGEAAMADPKGYYLPEESEPHQCTFMQWPVNRSVHPDPVFLEMLQASIANVANSIAAFEPVTMLMAAEHKASARRMLSDAVQIWDIPTDDLWCRDSGPCFVRNDAGDLAVRQFNFNGWGGKQVHGHDGNVAARVAERLGLPVLNNGLVGEPGGLEHDGEGTVIAHESSWVNPNRNSGSRDEIAALILEAVGAEKLIWAEGVYDQDITDYHIDALARFPEPGTILIQLPDESDITDDPFAASAYETYDILAAAKDAKGRKLEMVAIPQPYDIRVKAEDFVASYVNYYVCNGALIGAQFGDAEADTEARSILADLYPDREIVLLNVDPIGEVGGGIHCATQQMPLSD
ncbi:agmatine deiminase family protein [Alterisphingorhabdus coralli]|uniref:Agmatine deiminase family protein n=1 Tax=Alterisphingorhabdus coralli TaxID=3071408 RepID=A0AA97F9J1_9SPHN|nr:agmatine deiminase family protein [Parasphingorhabdus sp. SCSIO 66989]WOE75758.1 agmatine deiminase family protein [Parasphingorhabdus sp. SCSIO 66989]